MEEFLAALKHEDSIAFLLSVFVSFLIGYLTAWVLYGGRAGKVKKLLHKTSESLKQAEADRDTLRENLDLSKADMVRLERENHELLANNRKLEEQHNTWQQELKIAQRRTAQAEEGARSYSATIEDLNNQLLGLKTRLGKSGTPAPGAPTDTTATRLAALEEKISRLIEENSTLRRGPDPADYREAKMSLATLEKKFSALADENEALRNELAQSRGMTTSPPEVHPPSAVLHQVSTTAARNTVSQQSHSATAKEADDLTQIKGIGKDIAHKLHELGIRTFEQIGQLTIQDIERISAALPAFPGRIQRDDWVGQARRLFEEKSAKPSA